MVNASDVIQEHITADRNETSKLSKLCHAFASALSLNWTDTAFSILVNPAESVIKKSIQDAEWNKQIEQCIPIAMITSKVTLTEEPEILHHC